MGTSDEPPCDFAIFIAERHHLEVWEAEALLVHWMESYQRRAPGATERPDGAVGDRTRSCA